METVEEVMKRLSQLGSAQTVKTYRNHGATCETMGRVGKKRKTMKC